MKQKKAIIVFTRIPVPGKTKTRLMPYLNGNQCARLHTCFLRDIQEACEKTKADIFICHTSEGDVGKLKKIFGLKVAYFPQVGEGLGQRMYHALQKVLGYGYESCVLIGSDIPEINDTILKDSFQILKKKDVVFGPTKDGGYYLVGMKKPRKEVFENQTYGHGSVLENTVRSLLEKGIRVGYGKQLQDIDTKEDICDFRQRMRKEKKLQRTYTGKFLLKTSSISIIVPIYNEEKTIIELQKQLKPLQNNCEILFVDGGSSDRTLELIEDSFQVLHSKKGRANQMNMGAKESKGDILFFLHCDSELPKNPLEQIRQVMKDYRVGCFGIAFHSRNFFMFTCQVISNHRVKDRKVMFGDQGIFIERELFFEMGMFPHLSIMEDYQFSLTLKKRKEKLGMTRSRIYTSDRRFPKGTIPKLRLMWKMNRLRKMYREGVEIEKISNLYKDIR